MRICMAPSSPHAMRTYHLLGIPDKFLVNDSRQPVSHWLINIASLGHSRWELASKSAMPMYDSVGVVNTLFCPFFGKRAQRISLAWRAESRAPFFGVHRSEEHRV